MLECVDRTIPELSALIGALVETYGLDRTRVCAVGISMGAYVVYQAIANGVALRASVAIVGSPERPGARSPHTSCAQFEHTAMLSVVAEYDASVPPDAAHRFHSKLTAHHPTAVQQIVELPRVGHLMSSEQWQRAMVLTDAWLAEYGHPAVNTLPSASPV